MIEFQTTSAQTAEQLGSVSDYILWYAKQKESLKYFQLYVPKDPKAVGGWGFNYVETQGGARRPLTRDERQGFEPLPDGGKVYMLGGLASDGTTTTGTVPFVFRGKSYHPGTKSHWKTTVEGMTRLAKVRRIEASANQIRYVRFFDDFPVQRLTNQWIDSTQAGYVDPKLYAVQTLAKVVQRCLLMTTDPGDLVLDPTCGSGTTAYVAEAWGRRWITIDTSRVPLALARQRLLTATFAYYQLAEEKRGPVGGFVYKRKQNKRGEEVGGIVPHVTLKSIANDEPPEEEVLVDRPEVEPSVTRVSGPFAVEGTIPPPIEMQDEAGPTAAADTKFADRMLEVLRKSPVLRLEGNRTVTLKNVRPPAKSLSLSAEAIQNGEENKPVAFAFGPENGPVTETLVHQALREANMKGYAHLYVIGFAIQPNAQADRRGRCHGRPGNLCPGHTRPDDGRPAQEPALESDIQRLWASRGRSAPAGEGHYVVELLGLDVFDPITMEAEHRQGNDVPAWFLDTDYNNLCFHVCQAFFPRTSAWDNLKRRSKESTTTRSGTTSRVRRARRLSRANTSRSP